MTEQPIFTLPAWYFDEIEGRYYNSEGKYLTKSEALDYVDKSISSSKVVSDNFSSMLFDSAINLDTWELSMRNEIKKEYIREYLLGIGGRNQMTFSDWGKVGNMLREQYDYLSNFKNDIENNDYSEAYVANRARMYIDSSRKAFNTAFKKSALIRGYDEEKWVLDDLAAHCGDCPHYADMGWLPSGVFPVPGDGTTECLTKCKCHIEYRKSSDKESEFWS